jgi:hypothetical protein
MRTQHKPALDLKPDGVSGGHCGVDTTSDCGVDTTSVTHLSHTPPRSNSVPATSQQRVVIRSGNIVGPNKWAIVAPLGNPVAPLANL